MYLLLCCYDDPDPTLLKDLMIILCCMNNKLVFALRIKMQNPSATIPASRSKSIKNALFDRHDVRLTG